VRQLCTDRDPDHENFQRTRRSRPSSTLNNGNVRYAAADALDQIAASQALILKYIEVNGLRTNGQAVANALPSAGREPPGPEQRSRRPRMMCISISSPGRLDHRTRLMGLI